MDVSAIDSWPKWLRWLTFIPLAVLAMIAMHFLVAITFRGEEDQASIFGVDVEGSAAVWINTIKFHVLARSIEPWAFVSAGGIVAPGGITPAISLAVLVGLVSMIAPTIFLAKGAAGPTIGLLILWTAIAVLGAIGGVLTVRRVKD